MDNSESLSFFQSHVICGTYVTIAVITYQIGVVLGDKLLNEIKRAIPYVTIAPKDLF
jgi:hypothetical protein